MKHAHSLRFETLEARQLLSAAHVPVAHRARAAPAPLVLNGTLTVDNNPNAFSTTTNADGSTTSSVPVAGQLGALGQVHGIWNESVDEYGDYLGPDTLSLRNSKGTFTVAFNDQSGLLVHTKAHGPVSYEHTQRALGGAGAYARAPETGSIDMNMNAANTEVVSITLHTRNI